MFPLVRNERRHSGAAEFIAHNAANPSGPCGRTTPAGRIEGKSLEAATEITRSRAGLTKARQGG